MATLYVTEIGARVEKEHGRLLVTKEDEVLAAVPLAHVSEVVLIGSVGITTPALLTLLDQECGLTFISRQGKLRGRLQGPEARNVALRRQQYDRSADPAFAREVSRNIVLGKLRNCRTLARRMMRKSALEDGGPGTGEAGPSAEVASANAPSVEGASVNGASDEGAGEDALARLNAALGRVPLARDEAELRGLEGAGSKAYFALLRAALRPAGLTFDKRTRRPPRDPVNALLSLSYSLLGAAMFTACEVAGLDAYAGFFHADKYGRPALALDLLEEFRPVVADSVVLTVANNRMVTATDFVEDPEGGVRLTRRGLRKFLGQFTRRLETPVFHPEAGRAISYQKVFEVQARRLRKCIESGTPDYRAFNAK